MKRRDFLGITVTGAAALLCKPSKARALGGKLPEIGEQAPHFDLPGTLGGGPSKDWSLENWSGRWLVLYFYPRDFTSGCTIEAHGFQESLKEFNEHQCDIAAVSADSVDDHESFCSSEGLDFTLLSDPEGKVSRQYGSWMAPYSLRHTFLIDPKGVLRARWTGVRPVGHAQDVLNTLVSEQSHSIA
ncbi:MULTISPECIES: peroxiredoxin [unclassified Synechococcus]|uniref:peroxiredoxin n=1 Tax=unclassified Synechococcus TaxID=2626047 RepID=UPI000832EC21